MTLRIAVSLCALLPLAGCVAMSSPTATSSAALYGELEQDVNRLGSDFRDFDLAEADPQLCQRACDDDARCQAWTYVRPGIQAPAARCWLKAPVPLPLKQEPCCVSGVKAAPAPAASGLAAPG